MLLIGFGLLCVLAWNLLRRSGGGRRIATTWAILDVGAALSVVLASFGYVFLLLFSGGSQPNC